jgi:hypothetical protein
MILDGASSHGSKETILPKNFTMLKLPPYSPELNPTEPIWRMLRKKCFGNTIYTSITEAITKVDNGFVDMAKDKRSMMKLTNWPWIEKTNKN